MDFLNNFPGFTFTRLHARITEEEGAFSVSVRMHNHLKHDEKAWGEEIATSIDITSETQPVVGDVWHNDLSAETLGLQNTVGAK
jgi:hypothetical protein